MNCEKCLNCTVAEDLESCKVTTMNDVSLLKEEVQALRTDVHELLEIFRASKGFVKVLSWFGKGVLWTAKVSAVFGGIWLLIKGIIK